MQARPIFFLCTIHAVTLLQCWYHCPATKTPHVVVTSQGQYLCLCTHRCPVLTELETLQQSFSHTQGCSSQLAGQTSQTHQSSTRATALFQAFKRCSAAEESWKAWERAWMLLQLLHAVQYCYMYYYRRCLLTQHTIHYIITARNKVYICSFRGMVPHVHTVYICKVCVCSTVM